MKKGFTLIEVVLVSAIILIIGTIIIGAFSGFNKSVALTKDAEKIVSLL